MALRHPAFALLALPVLFFAVFFLAPLVVVLGASFSDGRGHLSLVHYARVLLDQYHWEVIATTFRIAGLTTVCCLLIGYPLAWYLVRIARWPAWRRVCLLLVVIPLFTSNIVRSFGWMVLLGRQGLVNSTMVDLGLIERPIRLLGTDAGILIGMVYILLPFVVLSVGNALDGVDPSLEHASEDLGARPWQTFLHVVLPLTLPGVMAGAVMVFSLAVSAYVTPALLSGGRVTVLSMLIFQQYSSVFDFHFGGALSMVLLLLTLALLAVAARTQPGHWRVA